MAGRAGFAPATLCLTGTCSTGLSYQPIWRFIRESNSYLSGDSRLF